MTHLNAVVHHHVPVLTSQDLQRCSFTNTSIIVNYKRGISYIGISETWKTVKQAWKKSSKVAREASGPNLPPKSWKKNHKHEKSWRGRDGTCMPRRAKMKMKRTRRTSRATMEAMESTRDLTKPPMAFQYLWEDNRGSWRSILSSFHLLRDFEGSQKTDAPHNRETHGWHNLTKFTQRRKAKNVKTNKNCFDTDLKFDERVF